MSVSLRVLVTLGVLAAGAVVGSAPAPWAMPPEYAYVAGGVLSLGIVPYVAAFQVVELVAFAVPRWRRLVRGGPAERERLWRVAFVVALIFAALQAGALASSLKAMVEWSPFAGGPELDPATPALMVGWMVLATAGVGLAARLIDQRGVGAGFALLVGVALARDVASPSLELLASDDWRVPALVVAAVVVLGVWRLTGSRTFLWGGVEPANHAASVGSIPGLAANAILGLQLVLVAAGSALLVVVLRRPDRVAGVGRPTASRFQARRAAVLESRPRALIITLAVNVIVLLPFIPGVLPGLDRLWMVLLLTSLAALILDLGEEVQVRRRTAMDLVPAWPLHHLWLVEPARSALAAAEIPAHVRSVRYRALMPWDFSVAMHVLVPPDQVERARDVLSHALEIGVGEDDLGAVPRTPILPTERGTPVPEGMWRPPRG